MSSESFATSPGTTQRRKVDSPAEQSRRGWDLSGQVCRSERSCLPRNRVVSDAGIHNLAVHGATTFVIAETGLTGLFTGKAEVTFVLSGLTFAADLKVFATVFFFTLAIVSSKDTRGASSPSSPASPPSTT